MTTPEHASIAEVRQVTLTRHCDPRYVNDLLAAGWQLLATVPQPGDDNRDALTLYSLGRPRGVAVA